MDKSTFVDFKGLNHACPKDDFSLQTIELMVNATIGQCNYWSRSLILCGGIIEVQSNRDDTKG